MTLPVKRKIHVKNKSGHSGVSWSTHSNMWIANAQVDGKQTYLGSFDRVEDAIKARQKTEPKVEKTKEEKQKINNHFEYKR